IIGLIALAIVGSGALIHECQAADSRPLWTTSRITGSPEPPPLFKIERAFPKLSFKNPLHMTLGPTGDRFFVSEQAGKIFSFKNDPACAKADLFFNLTSELQSWDKAKVKGVDAVYALAFHPQFAKNRFCYICYILGSQKP